MTHFVRFIWEMVLVASIILGAFLLACECWRRRNIKVLMLAPLLLLCGCKIPQGTVVSMTTSVIGIRVGENPKTQTPELQIGFFRATYQFVPTSTNQIYAPMVNSGLSMDHKAFTTSVDEDFQTGGAKPPTNSVAIRGVVGRAKSAKEDVK